MEDSGIHSPQDAAHTHREAERAIVSGPTDQLAERAQAVAGLLARRAEYQSRALTGNVASGEIRDTHADALAEMARIVAKLAGGR